VEQLFKILGTQGIFGLAFLIAISLVFLTGYLYKRESKRTSTIDSAVIQSLTKSLTAIQIHVEQSQRADERYDESYRQFTGAVQTLIGIVEQSTVINQSVSNSINTMNSYLAVLKDRDARRKPE